MMFLFNSAKAPVGRSTLNNNKNKSKNPLMMKKYIYYSLYFIIDYYRTYIRNLQTSVFKLILLKWIIRRCSSSVGRDTGEQEVSIGEGCVYFGIVIHELMHAVGFWHEQSRADRDQHVTIMWDNILRGMEYNFQRYEWSFIQSLGTPYDTGWLYLHLWKQYNIKIRIDV